MLKVIKDKNWLVFVDENEKTRKFDINTGKTYGVRGTEIKSKIPHCKDYYCGYARHTYENISADNAKVFIKLYCDECYNLLPLADKIFNLGFNINAYDLLHYESFLATNFKPFIKFMKEKEYVTITEGTIDEYKCIKRRKQFETMKRDHFVTDEIIDIVANNPDITAEKAPVYAYFLARGLLDFYGFRGYTSSRFGRYDDALYSAIRRISRYIQFCDKKGYKPDTKEQDIFRTLVNAEKEMRADEIIFDNNALSNFYAQKNWNLEDDNLFIKIPTCREDFIDEANQQNNCVYSNYFRRTVRGDSYVVFIRRKDNPNKSYITCEISTNGYIHQYLTTNNNRVEDEMGVAFLTTLKDFIINNW